MGITITTTCLFRANTKTTVVLLYPSNHVSINPRILINTEECRHRVFQEYCDLSRFFSMLIKMATAITLSGFPQTRAVNVTCEASNDGCSGSGDCSNTYNCGTGSWYYNRTCGGQCGNILSADGCIYFCSGPDLASCPQIGTPDQGAMSASFSNPDVATNYTPGSAPLNCTYSPSAFATATYTQMRNVTQHQSTSNVTQYNEAFTTYCFQEVTQNCPIDITTNSVMPSCSRAASTGQDGLLCKQWLAQVDSSTRDNAIVAYCTSHMTPDCTCAVPQPAGLFQQLNRGIGLTGSPQCWWVPCKIQTGAYLIPSAYLNQSVCPQNVTVCENIVNFVNATIESGGQVNINEIDNYTGCGISNNGGGNSGFLGFIESYWWVFVIILIVIILFLVIFFWLRRRRSR